MVLLVATSMPLITILASVFPMIPLDINVISVSLTTVGFSLVGFVLMVPCVIIYAFIR